jgi:APA family basic amino acid/polyamine antiporter
MPAVTSAGRAAASSDETDAATHGAGLVRALGAWDGALITIGAMLGSGIFLTTSDIARRLPHAGLILVLWLAGGALTLAGALAYAELGAMFPRAGGPYHYLKEAYGPFWAFLYGWTSFLIIMSGGLATIAVGFGEYLQAFVHLADLRLGGWTVRGSQLAAALAIAFLTAVNYLGVRRGAWVQNVATGIKVLALVGLALVGLLVPPVVAPEWFAPLPPGGLVAGLGLGMVGVLWTYDGWYVMTFEAGEMRNPARDLPRGLVLGVAAVVALYVLINCVYLRALPLDTIGRTPRIGEAAAGALLGPIGARLAAALILVATFGCLAANVLCCARIYLPMAQDGLFFHALAHIHPRYRTPGASLLAQGAWSIVLALSGTFEQLYTWVVFASVLFQGAVGAALYVLRRTRPDLPRPYRTWGYPWVTGAFVLSCLALSVVTLAQSPRESLLGVALMASGVPAFLWWRRRSRVLGLSSG